MLLKRHAYRSSNGDVWSLMTDLDSKRQFVRHEANQTSGGAITDLEGSDFLSIGGAGPEFSAIRQMIERAPPDLPESEL